MLKQKADATICSLLAFLISVAGDREWKRECVWEREKERERERVRERENDFVLSLSIETHFAVFLKGFVRD